MMMMRKLLLRVVIVLVASLFVLGILASVDEDTTLRLYENARTVTDRAKQSIGLGLLDPGMDWDRLMDVGPLLAQLEAGDKSFDWSNWLDLDKTKLFDKRDLDPKLYPYLSALKLTDELDLPLEQRTTPLEQAMLARLYCRDQLPAPFRIVPLTNPSHTAPKGKGTKDKINLLTSPHALRQAPMKQYEVTHTNMELRHRQYGHKEPTGWYPASEPPATDLKANASELSLEDLLFPQIPTSMFTWRVDDYLEVADFADETHALTVWQGWADVAYSGKHFNEVWLRDDPAGYGVHYDWRFFRGVQSHDEHLAAIHACARAWQQFAELMGISYWYAHGSLLGHMWNGMAMPWDSDHDIQVPVMELDRLARDFNRTLVVQDPSEGHRKFLIDVSPFYVQRIRGNAKNVIDARFIDVDTGTYIDITGLARTDPTRQMVSCKNRHTYRAEEYARLRRTKFEGYPALIPLNGEKSLAKEYKLYKEPKFEEWVFNDRVQLWEFKQDCETYLKKFKGSTHVYCYPSDIRADDGCMESYGTCDAVTLREYERTKAVTADHLVEAKYIEALSPLDAETDWESKKPQMQALADLLGHSFPPFHNSSVLIL